MRKTETQAGKGFKLQTLRAIEIFLDAIIEHGKEAKVFIATEMIGDVYHKINDEHGIEEVKNYKAPHSINSEEIKNTLINFLDSYINFRPGRLSFSFYSTAGIRETDNKNLTNSILYYLQNEIYNTTVIEKVKGTILPYYNEKNLRNSGNYEHIKDFSEVEWIDFLGRISWKFNLLGNQEITEVLQQKCKKVINNIEPEFLTLNGLEKVVLNEFKDQLERKLEESSYYRGFEFKDFENIVYKEIAIRSFKKNRNYGKFLKFEDYVFPITSDCFYFTNYERQLIQEITDQLLHSSSRNFVLLTGKSAQGKTVLARQIASNFEHNGFLTLFVKLNSRTRYDELNLERISIENSKVFCLITNSHQNLTLINEILFYKNKYQSIKFIFESRIIDRAFESEENELFNDEYVEEKRLEFNKHADFTEKYFGIVRTFTADPIDLDLLIKATGRNFLFLYEYLKNIQSLGDKIEVYSSIDDLLQLKYSEKKYDDLKEFAIINQYEIPLNYEYISEKSNVQFFIRENHLIADNSNSDYYNLYHSDFARLLLKSSIKNKNFNEFQILEHEINAFKKYLTLTNFSESPAIVKSLYTNSAYKLLKALLTRELTKIDFFRYYSEPDNFKFLQSSSKPIRDFLRITEKVCPDVFPEYLQAIIIKNQRLKEFFTSDSSFIYSLIEISTLIKRYLPSRFEEFNRKLPEYFLHRSNDIHFSAITFYINQSYKNNKVLYEILIKEYLPEQLKRIALQEEFLSLTEGLLQLNKLDDFRNFIESIKTELIDKSQNTSLYRFSLGLKNIRQATSLLFATKIFEQYPEELLKSELLKANIKTALISANILSTYGRDRVYENFHPDRLNVAFEEFSFSDISKLFLEADKFINNQKISSGFIDKIQFELLVEKILKSNPYQVAHSLHLLHKRRGFKDFIEKLFYGIPSDFFIFFIEQIDIFSIVETLHRLKSIDKSGINTNQCFLLNIDTIINFDYGTLPLERIVLIFTFLKNINREKTISLLQSCKTILKEKANENSYKEIGITMSRLANIDSKIANELLNEVVRKTNFIDFLEAQEINIVSHTLKEIQIADNNSELGLINNLYLKLKTESLIKSIANIKFDVVCHSLNELGSIETKAYNKTRKLVWEIGIERFNSSMLDTPFIGVCTGLVALNKVNKKFTSEIYNYSIHSIVKISTNSTLREFSDGLKAIASVDSSFAIGIFNSNDINLKILGSDAKNYDLKAIKRCVYFLKSIDKPTTRKLIGEMDSQSLVLKFKQEYQFDTASEMLSQLYEINNSKIEDVVRSLSDDLYSKCESLEINVISKGLSEIAKINQIIAKEVLTRLSSERDILKEVSQLQFDIFGKTIREIDKIEFEPDLSKRILSYVSIDHIVKKASKMSEKQLNLGFGALKKVDLILTIMIAKQLVNLKPKLKKSLRSIKDLVDRE